MIRTKNALLIFQDGSFFPGKGLGAVNDVSGELVFNTGMTGYQEAITDPPYARRILVFCYPLIGNYGFSDGAFESVKPHLQGVVVKEACEKPVHYASTQSLDEFLFDH